MDPSQYQKKGPGDRPARGPRAAGDLLPGALKALGVPSARLTGRVHAAWSAASEEGWRDHTELKRLVGGVLEIGVGPSALRDELTHFHRERLLVVLRTALPDVPLIGLRFVSASVAKNAVDGDDVR